ncbi:MAG TPA: RNA-binding domain-containing protein [Candidatus Bathyarchaeia archaeon]|nr:RNA-binding domain-containing protein [Candidatus Bathyarchaeia archaeon]
MISVRSVRLSTIAHATEDRDKVKTAMWSLCPQQEFHSKIDEKRLKGHHGNEIHLLTMTIPPRKTRTFAEFLWKRLSSVDQQSTLDSIERHHDERNVLHLRLSKQDGFSGRFRIADEDIIKVELAFRTWSTSPQKASDEIRELLKQLDQVSDSGSQPQGIRIL